MGNPLLSNRYRSSYQTEVSFAAVMGFSTKLAMLFAVMLFTATYVWGEFFASAVMKDGKVLSYSSAITWSMLGGSLGAFVVGLIIVQAPGVAPVLSFVYAALEGLAIGGVSAYYESKYPGVAVNATLATFGIFGVAGLLYTTRIIRVTSGFVSFIAMGTAGMCVIYGADLILALFGINTGLVRGGSRVFERDNPKGEK